MLKVRGLSLIGNLLPELTDISLTVGRGEVSALIGPTEAGISLLISAIAEPDADYLGEVIISHYKAKAEPDRVRLMIGSLLQPFEPPLHLTGFEYLELVGSFYGLGPDERATRIIQLANVFDANRSLYTVMERVSPAIKQKIGLMASMISSPPVVLWDEPLLHLDPAGQQIVKEVIKELKNNDTSLLLTSNNLDFVEAVADNILVFHSGQIAAQGSLTELARLTQADKKLSTIYRAVARRHE